MAGRSRRSTLLLMVVLALCAIVLLAPTARASCVGPVLSVGEEQRTGAEQSPAPARVDRTAPLTVTGILFRHGCEDTVGYVGCTRAAPTDPETPMRQVVLTLEQGGRTWQLGVADAGGRDSQYGIRWEVTLPDDVASGPAELVADTARRSIEIVA